MPYLEDGSFYLDEFPDRTPYIAERIVSEIREGNLRHLLMLSDYDMRRSLGDDDYRLWAGLVAEQGKSPDR